MIVIARNHGLTPAAEPTADPPNGRQASGPDEQAPSMYPVEGVFDVTVAVPCRLNVPARSG
jgi:hypothetical protein